MEYLGLMSRLFAGDEQVLATDYGRMLFDKSQSSETGFYEAAMILIRGSLHEPPQDGLARTGRRDLVAGCRDRRSP